MPIIGILLCIVFVIWNPFHKESEVVNNELKDETIDTPSIELQNTIEYITVTEIQNMKANSIIDDDTIKPEEIKEFFYSTEITDDIKERIWGISYQENSYISLENLRYLRILHWGFDGETHIGEIIVNKSITEDILEIMYELYKSDYMIEKMVLIDEYGGDDEKSMQDNNSSGFNYRVVSGSSTLSKHSFGMAIDINPLYNPYVVKKSNGTVSISPKGSEAYVDRNGDFPYMLTKDDLCVKLFKEHGFTWGGVWNSVKDYQHFEK